MLNRDRVLAFLHIAPEIGPAVLEPENARGIRWRYMLDHISPHNLALELEYLLRLVRVAYRLLVQTPLDTLVSLSLARL